MTNPKLTDDTVSRLPLDLARADLLEEIMKEPNHAEETSRRPARGAVAVLAAAAAAAAAVAAPQLIGRPAPEPAPETSAVAAGPAAAPEGGWLALDAPGWRLDYVWLGEDEMQAQYVSGDQTLEMTRMPEAQYEDYYADRARIPAEAAWQPGSGPDAPEQAPDLEPVAGEPVTLAGAPAELWAYSPRDHTSLGEVRNGWFPEVRGTGMSKQEYLAVLPLVRAVSSEEFEAAMPEDFVNGAERDGEIADLLAQMPAPAGLGPVTSDQADRYQLIAEVSTAVTCAWLEQYESGDPAARDRAVTAMGGSREWVPLRSIVDDGDWSETIWWIADLMEQGTPAAEIRERNGGMCG